MAVFSRVLFYADEKFKSLVREFSWDSMVCAPISNSHQNSSCYNQMDSYCIFVF